MSADLVEAARNLADVLMEENAALAALDLKQTGALVAGKERAVAAFTAALAGSSLDGAGRPLAQRLRSLADENKTLLERAIAAQGRVMAVFAQAAARQPGYGAASGRVAACRPVPFALAAQA
ncbi:MAG TPA: hypothetical protein VKQ27_16440 [Acetobacteraceae bacterium]|nr:hypothetical protein [Acetobacteraceae bacterium]